MRGARPCIHRHVDAAPAFLCAVLLHDKARPVSVLVCKLLTSAMLHVRLMCACHVCVSCVCVCAGDSSSEQSVVEPSTLMAGDDAHNADYRRGRRFKKLLRMVGNAKVRH